MEAEEEGADEGGLVFAPRLQAVGSIVGRVKWSVRLKDDVRLPGDVVRGVLWAGEHRGLRVGRRRIRKGRWI